MKRLLLLALVAGVALVSGCAVTPVVQFQHSTFEGFDVVSYVPEHPYAEQAIGFFNRYAP